MSNNPTRLSASDLHDLSLDPRMNKEKIYDKWAETYDGYVNKLNYLAPKNVAKEVFDFLEEMKIDHLKILDFGCASCLKITKTTFLYAAGSIILVYISFI